MSSEPNMSDAQFTHIFSAMIGGLILLTIMLIILAILIGSGVRQSDINAKVRDARVAERIEPTGRIAVEETPEPATVAATSETGKSEVTSGESVYQSSCVACHANGVASAPVFGDTDAWADRIEKPSDTLYQRAIEGFQGSAGVMPPKGGNMSLSDEEVKAAVDHMIGAAR